MSMAIGFAVFLLFFWSRVPGAMPIAIIYISFIEPFNSMTGAVWKLSRRSERFRRCWIFKAFALYFPARLHRTVELQPTRKYVFGYHPHGIICHGAFLAFGTDALDFSRLFPGITNVFLTLDSNFCVPLYREYILSLGLGGVSGDSCRKILSNGGHDGNGMGRAITIAVGGARESLLATPGTMRLLLRDRKGFIKLAIEEGADLVPVLGFGENCLYYQKNITHRSSRLLKLQLCMKNMLGWTAPMFRGRSPWGGPGLMPYRKPLDIVVGRPIEVAQCFNPDGEYVDLVHKRYMDEIERMWNEWKDIVPGDAPVQLEFV